MTATPITLSSAGSNTGEPISFIMDDCDGLDHVVALIKATGLAGYEAPYPALVTALVRALPGAMLDIGANTGLFALLAADARRSTTVHAFEPLPSIRQRMLHNLALNPNLAPRIVMHTQALSDRTGEATFYETINPYGLLTTSSTLDAPFAHEHGQLLEHTMQTTTLDQWVRTLELPGISFIKMDVEGHEQAVLQGAADTVQRYRPVIGIELLSAANFAFFERFLAEHDFVDCATTVTSLTVGPQVRFISEGWNHLFTPLERLPVVLAAARAAGLSIHGA
jgi:FkbM family methyltransferase